jgi:hypothetical protein
MKRRAPSPSARVIDRQSVEIAESGRPPGYDAGKKVKGRRRHIITDTIGLLVGAEASQFNRVGDAAAEAVARANAEPSPAGERRARTGHHLPGASIGRARPNVGLSIGNGDRARPTLALSFHP